MNGRKNINDKLVGKTIQSAEVEGGYVEINFTDGTNLLYYASDGGYSYWRFTDSNGDEL